MNFRIKRVRIERVRIAPARPILSKRFWIAAILFRGWAFSSLSVRFFELKAFLLHVALCEVQSCVRNSARLLPRICWSFARRRWTPLGLSWVRYFSVSSMSMLQLLRFILCQDEFSKALTLLRRGTRFGVAPRGNGASETQFLSSFRDVEQLFPDWEDEHSLRHFRVSSMRKVAYACLRLRPRFKRARLENQCDRDSRAASKSFDCNQRDSNSVWPGP